MIVEAFFICVPSAVISCLPAATVPEEYDSAVDGSMVWFISHSIILNGHLAGTVKVTYKD